MNLFEDDISSMIDLGDIPRSMREHLERNKIAYRKKLSDIKRTSQQTSKLDKCIYCEATTSRFCNSHTLPAFALRNISINGEILNANSIVELPLIDMEKGVGEAGVFRLLCQDCDSMIFRDYENISNYNCLPSMKMLAQIAMKNYLKLIGKRNIENSLYGELYNQKLIPEDLYRMRMNINQLDLREYYSDYRYAKKVGIRNLNDEYYMFYYQKLDYVVPMAFQGSVTVICDFEGRIINNIYDNSIDTATEELHICIFPLSGFSVIIMFIDERDKRYKNFIRQFRRMSSDMKLLSVAYIVFLYSEEFFLSKSIDKSILNNEKIKAACRLSVDMVSEHPMEDPVEHAAKHFNLSLASSIPNILGYEYRIQSHT